MHVRTCTCLCADEEGDMDVHDRGMLYYRLLKHDVKEAQKVVCGQPKTVAEENTVIPRVCSMHHTYVHEAAVIYMYRYLAV